MYPFIMSETIHQILAMLMLAFGVVSFNYEHLNLSHGTRLYQHE